jgi:hypothetical protein
MRGKFLRKVLEQVGYLPPLLRGVVEVGPNGASEKAPKAAKKRRPLPLTGNDRCP